MERSGVADRGKEFAIGGAMSAPTGSEWRLHAARTAVVTVGNLWLSKNSIFARKIKLYDSTVLVKDFYGTF